jgi:plastocyanin
MKKILSILIFLFLFHSPLKAAIIDIAVTDNEFTPPSVNVNVGDQIRWTLVEGLHTTSSMNVPPGAATWNYQFNFIGDMFIYDVTVAGFYDYECLFHGGMEGDFTASAGQQTYTWDRFGQTESWTNPNNWIPVRTTPAADDLLIFSDNGGSTTVTDVPTQTIGGMFIGINTQVTLQAGASGNTLTIDGGMGADLNVEAGGSLNVNTANALNIFINSGSTAIITGNMHISGVAPGVAHRINGADANSIDFYGTLTQGIGFIGNIFTNGGTPNVVYFHNGSVFVFQAGSNPFGLGQPNSKVVFESGSLYRHESTNTPAFSGRTYADFELNVVGSVSGTGGATLSMDNITVTEGTLNINTTGTTNIKGNITVALGKTLTFTPGSAVSHNIIFNGLFNQIISGLGTLTFGPNANVTIDNAFGVTLNKEITFNRVLALVNGNINTNFLDMLTLGTDASVTGGSNSSYINGPVLKNTNSTAAFTFPVGKGGVYMPIGIIPSSTDLTEFVGEYFNTGNINQSPVDPPIDHISSVEYFQLNRFSGTANANVILSWGSNSGVTNLATLIAARWTGSTWVNEGNTATTGDPSGGTVTSNVVSSFSPFSLASTAPSPENPLPVELTDFVATTIKNEVILDWGTSGEINNDGFEVMRVMIESDNPGDDPNELIFETLAFIPGNGTTNQTHRYRYIDKNLTSGTYLYKLKQRDYNSHYTFFLLGTEVVIGIPEVFSLSQNYPNPFNPVTKIAIELPFDGTADLTVYDITGKEVSKVISGKLTGGYHYIDFQVGNLSSGTYFYRLSFSGNGKVFSEIKKMVVVK